MSLHSRQIGPFISGPKGLFTLPPFRTALKPTWVLSGSVSLLFDTDQRVRSFSFLGSAPVCGGVLFQDERVQIMGDFWDAWWQQTYQVKSIVLGHVRTLRTT